MAHPEMAVSLKVLKNKRLYRIEPVHPMKKATREPDRMKLMGIRLKYVKTGKDAWFENGGVIRLDQLSEESREYVLFELTARKQLDLFNHLGT